MDDPRVELSTLTGGGDPTPILHALDSVELVIEAPPERQRSREDQVALYNLVSSAARLFPHVTIRLEPGVRCDLSPFKRHPLVFLNACGTAQGQELYRSGFIGFFASELGAAAVVGTLAEIPADDAYEVARAFMQKWLRGARAAQALREIRYEQLKEKRNPFAMYFTLHGAGYLSLTQPIQMEEV